MRSSFTSLSVIVALTLTNAAFASEVDAGLPRRDAARALTPDEVAPDAPSANADDTLAGSSHTANASTSDDAPRDPAQSSMEPLTPCPAGATCVDDAILAARLLDVDRAQLITGSPRARSVVIALHALAALKDPRSIPVLLAASRSKNTLIRRGAIAALAPFTDDTRVRARLTETLLPDTPDDELVLALPLLAASMSGSAGAPPCPVVGRCVDDAVLVRRLLAIVDEHGEVSVDAVHSLAELDDVRSVPVFLRLADVKRTPVRHAALQSLSLFATSDQTAVERLISVLDGDASEDIGLIVPLVAANPAPSIGDALVRARTRAVDPALRESLDAALTIRDPTALAAIRAEEERLARERAAEPTTLDLFGRSAIAVATAGAGACGGAAASSFAADLVLPGAGACFGLWGCCVGAGSGAALGWFLLGREGLTLGDVGLTLSSGVMGLYAGALIPSIIGAPATDDLRHTLYASAGGAIAGLTLGTTAALFVDPDGSDLVELWTSAVLVNLLGYGFVLGLSPFLPANTDPRILPATLFASTMIGFAGGAAASPFIDLSLTDGAHVMASSVVGAALGAELGLTLAAYGRPGMGSNSVIGATAAGAGIGMLTGLVLSPLHLSPSWGGSLYELWATVNYSALGIGAGVLTSHLLGTSVSSTAKGALPFAAGALFGFTGAVSTAFFPEGIALDVGDLMLQPLLVGFSLYHVAALSLALSLSDSPLPMAYTTAASLIAPSVTSAVLLYTAPLIDVSIGDSFVIGASMAWGGAMSALTLASVSGRVPGGLPTWSWILATSLAVDGALLAGIALDVVDDVLELDRLGWRYTYVSAVTAASMLVFALPGSLVAVAAAESGIFYVSDAFLISAAFGLALGLVTMPFVDFSIVPDDIWFFDSHIEFSTEEGGIEFLPTVVPVLPENGVGAPGLAFGLSGRF
jgi:hypothetical protein